MSSDTIETAPGAITVDLEINALVLDAASARLPHVQNLERQKYGKAKTNLSTLAEEILRTWKPGVTVKPKPAPKVTCPHCEHEVSTYANGKLRVHGPADARCPVTFIKQGQPTVVATRPLRFPMNREEYEGLKTRIREDGQSVASVITQRFAHFARVGHL